MQSPKVLRMNLGSEPPSLDWNLADDFTSFDIISNIMVGLTRYGEDSKGNIIAVPGVAESWQVNADATEYIFKLNKEARWTDGKQVTAQEFMDSFERLLNPETAAPYAQLLSIIDLEKSEAIETDKLKVVLKQPAPYFIYLTSYGLTLPIRKDLIAKYGKNWTEAENLVSNGPFKLKKWQHEYKIELERNKNFHLYSKSPNEVEKLVFFMVPEQSSAYTLFENEQLDWIDSRSIPISELKKLKPESYKQISLLRNTYLGFNCIKKPFNNALVRKAFAYSIDRDTITKIRGKGDKAGTTWIPKALYQFLDSASLPEEYRKSFNPQLAQNYLRQAGYKNSDDFPEVEFLIPNREDSKLLAESLQTMWQQNLNIKVKITAMEWKMFLARLREDPPVIFRLNWGADYPDPDPFMQLFTSNNHINHGRYTNPEYDQIVTKAASIQDLRERRRLYTKAERILSYEDMAISPLYVDSQIFIAKDHVKNLYINAMDIVQLDRVSIDQNSIISKP